MLALFLLLAGLVGAQEQCAQNCLECGQGTCFTCGNGYERDFLGNCLENIVDKCIIYSPSKECFACQPTFKMEERKCVKMTDGCINSDQGQCVDCGFGTISQNGKCTGTLNCKAFGQQPCTECREGYTLQGNKCVDNSAGCASVNPSNGICLSCKAGYFMSGLQCY